jgi:hypothetical protein
VVACYVSSLIPAQYSTPSPASNDTLHYPGNNSDEEGSDLDGFIVLDDAELDEDAGNDDEKDSGNQSDILEDEEAIEEYGYENAVKRHHSGSVAKDEEVVEDIKGKGRAPQIVLSVDEERHGFRFFFYFFLFNNIC